VRRATRVVIAGALLSPALLLAVAWAAPEAAWTFAIAVNAVSLLVTATLTFTASRNGDPRLRRARRCFTWALLSSATGSTVAAIHVAIAGVLPVFSPGKLAPLFWVPLTLVGLWAVPSERHKEGGRLRAVLDGVVVTSAAASIFWVLLLRPVYDLSEYSTLAKAVLMGYPTCDFVLGLVAFVIAVHARGDLRRFLRMVAAGLLLVAVADAGNAARIAASQDGFAWTSVLAQVGLAILICAALASTTASAVEAQPGRVAARVDAALPHVPVVLAVVIGLQQSLSGRSLDAVSVALASVMVLGLVARQAMYAGHLGVVAHRLAADATEDALTGLLNRRAWVAALEVALAERAPGEVAVVLLDMNKFKLINDRFGHAAGDAALVGFAQRLRSGCPDDSVRRARLGGDEFAMLIIGSCAQERALRHAAAVAPEHDMTLGPVTVHVGASAGVATSRPGDSTSTLLRRADLAMYDAKRAAATPVSLFTDDMAARDERRRLLTQSLSGAAARGELELEYQPLHRTADGALAVLVAGLRWTSREHGQVPHAELVELAAESGALRDLERWALSRAAAQVASWRAGGLVPPRVLLQVSARQARPGCAAALAQCVEEQGAAPADFVLELLEVGGDSAAGLFAGARRAGFATAVGGASGDAAALGRLAELDVDLVRFGPELVRELSPETGRTVVLAVLTLAGELGLTAVAPAACDAALVQVAGCRLIEAEGQRPLRSPEVAGLLQDWKGVPAPRPPVHDGAALT
jgi:diguanylate cyclase (GGDEF)-like protein